MTVEEIIAGAVRLHTGCGFTVDGQHVFCDDGRLDQHLDGRSHSLRCEKCDCRRSAPGIIAALDAAGYVVVPKEPTMEMVHAARPALKEFIDALPAAVKLPATDKFGGYWLHRDTKARLRYAKMIEVRPK